MAVAALAGLISFASVAFGWRVWIQYQRTGDAGLRGSWRTPFGVPVMLFGIAAIVAGVILDLADAADPLAPLLHPLVQGLGGLSFATGFVLTVRAQVDMGASWRIGVDATEKTALITCGVFRYVRNPIFTGMALAFAGVTLLVPNVVALVGLPVLVVGLQLQVRLVEEPHLVSAHGDAYRSYMNKAGRFVPWLGRVR